MHKEQGYTSLHLHTVVLDTGYESIVMHTEQGYASLRLQAVILYKMGVRILGSLYIPWNGSSVMHTEQA